MRANCTDARISLAATDLDSALESLQPGDAEVAQEPTEQPYLIRDCAFRDRRQPDRHPGTAVSGAIADRSGIEKRRPLNGE
jgi:hypothetical protein